MTTAVPTASAKQDERRAIGVACGAHALHDGYTDLVYVMLPIWQAEFGLGFAALGTDADGLFRDARRLRRFRRDFWPSVSVPPRFLRSARRWQVSVISSPD